MTTATLNWAPEYHDVRQPLRYPEEDAGGTEAVRTREHDDGAIVRLDPEVSMGYEVVPFALGRPSHTVSSKC